MLTIVGDTVRARCSNAQAERHTQLQHEPLLLRSAALAIVAAISLAGCGGSGTSPTTSVASTNSKPAADTAMVKLTFVVPSQTLLRSIQRTQAPTRAPLYVSASTRSLTVTVTPSSGAPLAALTVACSAVCTALLPAPVGSDTVALELTDASSGAGNALSLTAATPITVQPGITNTYNLTANPVVDHAAITVGAAASTGGTVGSTPVTVTAYDAGNNTIIGPGNFVDANGNPVTINVSVANNSDVSGTGAITLSQSSLAAPQSAPITASYNGGWLDSSTISLGLPATIAARSSATSSQAIAGAPMATEASYGLPAIVNNEYGITLGADGNFWVNEYSNSAIAQISPTGTLLHAYGVANGLLPAARPDEAILGPDNNVWFDDAAAQAIGKITTAGVITEYTTGICGSPVNITVGPDGRIWFAEVGCSVVGVISPAGGPISEFPIATFSTAIAPGADGNIWYVDAGPEIGVMSPSTGAVLHTYSSGLLGTPSAMILGPDGNVWFTDYGHGVGYITTAGVIHEFTVGLLPGNSPRNLTVGPDGNIWFTDQGNGIIGRCTLAGVITMFGNSYGVNPANGVFAITVGPDHDLWFTAGNLGLGRFVY